MALLSPAAAVARGKMRRLVALFCLALLRQATSTASTIDGPRRPSSSSSSSDRHPSHNDDIHHLDAPALMTSDPQCVDLRAQCSEWAAVGRCVAEARYMHPHCPVSCQVCHNRTRVEVVRRAVPTPSAPASSVTPPPNATIVDVVGADLGVAQIVPPKRRRDEMLNLLAATQDYVQEVVNVEERYKAVRSLCRHKHEQCLEWALDGQCDSNHAFMSKVCAPSCQTCEQLHLDSKCWPDLTKQRNAWYPGDVNRMFERILGDPEVQARYTPTVHSRPYQDDEEMPDDGPMDGPWIVTLEHFVSDAACDRMIELGAARGYVRSTLVGDLKEDGTEEGAESIDRTSTNTWCQDECFEDPHVTELLARMQNLTGIPTGNAESMQLLKYEVGQYYRDHNDYIAANRDRIEGVRILTVFLYLNDVVAGGGTRFPRLDLVVQPRKGRVVLWPSVLDHDPHAIDDRTNHQAMPVLQGQKYGCNAWFHQRDLQLSSELGCLG